MTDQHDPFAEGSGDGAPETGPGDLGALGAFGGLGGGEPSGGFDMGGLLEQAMQMQSQLMAAQAEAAAAEVEGQAGGGVVRVRCTGDLEFRSVHIEPEVVDPDDVELLADLVLAALRDAVTRAEQLRQQAISGSGMPDVGQLLEGLGGGGLSGGGLGGGAGAGAGAGLDLGALDGVDGVDDDEGDGRG